MPKIPTAGMTWTVSKEKHPNPALRIDVVTIQNQHQSLFLQYPNPKAWGQVTVAGIVTIHSNHDKSL